MTSKGSIQQIMAAGHRGYLVTEIGSSGDELNRWSDGPAELLVSLEQALAYWRIAGDARPEARPASIRLEDGTQITIHRDGDLIIAVARPPAQTQLVVATTFRRLVSVNPAQAGI